MKQKLETLLKLQETEMEIERLNSILDAVPEKLAALDAEKTSLREAYEKEADEMASLKKKYRDLESDVQTNTDRAAKSQEKLTAVKTNKEYQAILKEIDEFKEKNASIEDEMILYLEKMETAEADFAKKGEDLKLVEGQIEADKNSIREKAEEEQRKLASARELKQALSDDVDEYLKSEYDRTKKIVKTRALVPVVKATCQGCHLNIPPQMFIELQRGGELKYCPHCDRIIFWNELLE
jgi:predicted  nucleic acid-binding Zn-ribbon protein